MMQTYPDMINAILNNPLNAKLKEELQDFYDYLILQELGLGTIKGYLTDTAEFLRNFEVVSLDNINKYLLEKTTKTTRLTHLKGYSKYCYKKKKTLTIEEYTDIKELKKKDERSKRKKYNKYMKEDNTNIKLSYKFAVPLSQWNNCYEQLEFESQRMALFLGFNLGLRAQELINLQWKNINFKAHKNGTITITETEPDQYNQTGFGKGNGLKSEAGFRTIPLTPIMNRILLAYKENIDTNYNLDHDYLIFSAHSFSNHRFQPISYKTLYYWLNNKIKVKVLEEGYEIERALRPHILRNSFATNYIKTNGKTFDSMYILGQILGHEESGESELNFASVTKEYITFTKDELLDKMLDYMLKAGL